jgi:lycopene cyclase domain-containing protein
VITALIFIIWDEGFTRMGVWGFNEKYTTGIYLLHLPVEEVLFFICIPYACCFTYFALNSLIERDFLGDYGSVITKCLIAVSFIISVIYIDRWYTVTTFTALVILLVYRLSQHSMKSMGRFYFTFIVLLAPFFFVNGILTGSGVEQPVVWYNNEETLGIRIGTIPVEDLIYAMIMILLSITISEKFEARHKKNSPSREGLST